MKSVTAVIKRQQRRFYWTAFIRNDSWPRTTHKKL